MITLNPICKKKREAYQWIGLLVFMIGCTPDKTHDVGRFDKIRDRYQLNLQLCIQSLENLQSDDTSRWKSDYLKARDAFKRIEPLLSFVDKENYTTLNAPNILKVEEESGTDIKRKESIGIQVLEELIFTDSLDIASIKKIASASAARLKLIEANIDLTSFRDHHFLWMYRNAFLRVALTGITGFDSPVLSRSLDDARIVYSILKEYLNAYPEKFNDSFLLREWNKEIDAAIAGLKGDFNSFNRYLFIKEHTHTQLKLWNRTVADWNIIFPFELAIKNDAPTLFENRTFSSSFFTETKTEKINQGKVTLGQMLFNDPSLSKSGKISCATCHRKDRAFTDGLQKSPGQKRNSPTLAYAALQQQFFFDNRSGSLEGQIISVVDNISEFHTDLETLATSVSKNDLYKSAFDTLFHGQVTDYAIRNAIAHYVRSLNYFESKFDKDITEQESLLTDSEILGFNLFMGKAKCATCHFAPVFNGTVPPYFTETEMELLGVPSSTDTVNALIDPDPGRYDFLKTEERRHFFKTPTVRNIALTAPYMHNGVYATLEEVIDFYDRGGGWGIGIQQKYQTLPAEPLGLTEVEKKALIDFLNSLTDQSFMNNR